MLISFPIYRNEGNVLFNDALNTFFIYCYMALDMINDNSDSKRRNPLPPLYGLLSLISRKGFFYAPSLRQDTKAFVVQLYSCGALAEM